MVNDLFPNQTIEEKQKMIEEWNAEDYGFNNIHNCSICKNKRVVHFLDENGLMSQKKCDCIEEYEKEKELFNLGLKELKKHRLNNFKITKPFQKNMIGIAANYLTEHLYENQCLITCGQIGSGKTHIISAIAVELHKRDKKIVFQIWNELINELKNLNFNQKNQYDLLYRNLIDCDVLFLDDFLKGKYTETDIRYAFDIINARYNSNKAVVISTEHSIQKLIEIDEALASRLIEKCEKNIIEIQKDIKNNYRLYKNQ